MDQNIDKTSDKKPSVKSVLYDKVNVSIKTLDKVIITLVVITIGSVVAAFLMR